LLRSAGGGLILALRKTDAVFEIMRAKTRWMGILFLLGSVYCFLPRLAAAATPPEHVVDDQRLSELEKETDHRPIDSLLEQALGYDERGRFSQAAELYRQLAAQNVGVAELRLGWLDESGAGGEQSYALARAHYERAAALGALEANLRLGLMSLEGWGTPKDPGAAVAYLQLAAQAGYQPAQAILSQMYFTGAGVSRDLREALKWAEKAADTRNPAAQTLTGSIRQAASRLPRDVESAREWYELSAEQQYAEGMRAMASTFLTAGASPDEVDQGVRWLEWATESGDGRAAFQLAGLYLWYPLLSQRPASEDKARKLFQRGAATGDLASAEVLELEKEGRSLAAAFKYVMTVSMEDRYVQRVAARELTLEEKATNSAFPRPIKLVRPVYPAALLLTRTKGQVMVEFDIDRTGRVRDAHAISFTHPGFADPAVAAIKTWRFTPGIRNGRIVIVRAKQAVEFVPGNDPGLAVDSSTREYTGGQRPSEPRQIKYVSPSWPPGLLKGSYQLSLRYVIGADGAVHRAVVSKSSGFDSLDEAYLSALKQYRYLPAEAEGKAINIPAEAASKIEVRDSDLIAGGLDAGHPKFNLTSIAGIQSNKVTGGESISYQVRVKYTLASKAHGRVALSFGPAPNGSYRELAKKIVDRGEGEVELVAEVNLPANKDASVYASLIEEPYPGAGVPLAYEIQQLESSK
jgi:TonB family protein